MHEITTVQRTRTLSGVVSTHDMVSKTNLSFEKKKSGFVANIQLLKSETLVDRRPVPGVVDRLLEGIPITVATDDLGRVVEVQGFKDVLNRAKETLSGDAFLKVAPALDSHRLGVQFYDEWEAKFGIVRGKSLQSNAVWEVTKNIVFSDKKEFVRYTIYWLEGKGSGSLSDTVKIRAFTDSNPVELIREVRRWLPNYQPPAYLTNAPLTPRAERISEQVIYWIEPLTMLCFLELGKSTLLFEQLKEGSVVPGSIVEARRIELKNGFYSN